MTQYTDIDEWERAWKRTPSVKEFEEDWRGTLKHISGSWSAIRMEPAGDMEIWGVGDLKQQAVQDWWENRLNALAPEWLQGEKAVLMLRSAGAADCQHVRIKGYDDE